MKQKSQVIHKKSNTVFIFGGGERLTSLGKVVLPCFLEDRNVLLKRMLLIVTFQCFSAKRQ